MNDSVITIVIVTIIITLIPIVISIKAQKKTYELKNKDFEQSDFKVSKWLYFAIIIGSVLGIALFLGLSCYLIIRDGLHWVSTILALIGFCILGILIYELYILPRMFISIRDGVFIYCNGRKVKTKVLLCDINLVYFSNGYIIIDDGNKHKKVIPMYFKNISMIVAMLEYYRDTKTKNR